jgi:hypothetical protein
MAKPLVPLIIERARGLIGNQATWCQGTFAFLADGRRCAAHEAGAVRFCAYGALQRAAFDVTGKRALAEELAQKAAVAITDTTRRRAPPSSRPMTPGPRRRAWPPDEHPQARLLRRLLEEGRGAEAEGCGAGALRALTGGACGSL